MSFVFTFVTFLKIFSVVIPLLIAVAYFTMAERKIMGAMQWWRGPNVMGFVGLLQPLADGLKLFSKETTLPTNANSHIFLLAPALSFVLSLLGWASMPFSWGIVICDLNFGLLYLFAISALNVYGMLFAGWASNSKYSFLGALWSAAQMISYEISLGFAALNVILCSGSFNLTSIVLAQEKIWFVVPLLPIFFIFAISVLAETNWHPFDLPEAEAELVSGYNVEYSAMTFALFFLAEYANMLLMSTFLALLFLGGWLPIGNFAFNRFFYYFFLSFKIILGVLFFIMTRATLPWYWYDQLMHLGWKCFLPLSMGYFCFMFGSLISFNSLHN